MTSRHSSTQEFNRAFNRFAAALELLEQAEQVGVDFAKVEASLMVEEAEMELDRLCEPDPAFVW